METLYTALSPSGAIREANQVGTLQPTTLISYLADLGPVFDTRKQNELATYKVTEDILAAGNWRELMLDGRPVPTVDFAIKLISEGYSAMLVRSFARGAESHDLNMVIWNWDTQGNKLDLIDDENRLGL